MMAAAVKLLLLIKKSGLRMDKKITYDKIKNLHVHLYEENEDGCVDVSWYINEITTLDKFLDLIMPVIKEKLASLDEKR
jgi:hypothetical protein